MDLVSVGATAVVTGGENTTLEESRTNVITADRVRILTGVRRESRN
jgi:hypothetical protein